MYTRGKYIEMRILAAIAPSRGPMASSASPPTLAPPAQHTQTVATIGLAFRFPLVPQLESSQPSLGRNRTGWNVSRFLTTATRSLQRGRSAILLSSVDARLLLTVNQCRSVLFLLSGDL